MSLRKLRRFCLATCLAAFCVWACVPPAALAHVAGAAPKAAMQRGSNGFEAGKIRRVTFMDGKLAVNVPSRLLQEASRMLVYADEHGSLVLSAQSASTKKTPLDFLNEFEAEYKADDANTVVLRKGEVKVGNHNLLRIDLLTESEDAGKFYVSHVFGLNAERVFSIAVMADASHADAWRKTADDVIESLSDL